MYKLYVRHENNKLGSDNAFYCDLKTIRGIEKRINDKKSYYKKGIWKVYRFSKKYDENTYQLIGTIEKA